MGAKAGRPRLAGLRTGVAQAEGPSEISERWTAPRKTELVLRLLRGELLDGRHHLVTAHHPPVLCQRGYRPRPTSSASMCDDNSSTRASQLSPRIASTRRSDAAGSRSPRARPTSRPKAWGDEATVTRP